MTSHKLFLTLGLLSAGIFINQFAVADDWQFHLAGTVTNKSLSSDNDGWQAQNTDDLKLKQDRYIGALFDVKKSGWPVAIVLDVFAAGDVEKSNGVEEIGSTLETHWGVRKYWGSKQEGWETYAGGGIAIVTAEVSSEFAGIKNSQDDTDTGYWAGGGANWFFTDNWYAGVDLRYSTGTLKIFDQKREVDAVMAGLTVGYSF